MKQGAGEVVGRVRSTIIPLDGMELLLPNAVVAEVIDYHKPEEVPNSPNWYLGRYSWRGKLLPVVSFERIVGKTLNRVWERGRIVVLYGLGDKRRLLPYYGLVAQDLPRLSHVGASNIEADKGGISHKLIAANVVVDGGRASIPDVDAVVDVVSRIV